MGALPLEGITVVALEQAVAAPFATRQLADLGTPETPVKAGSPLADIAAGMYAFSGVLAVPMVAAPPLRVMAL